jgi:glycosyltransferase involved in cell wall biosynthesis
MIWLLTILFLPYFFIFLEIYRNLLKVRQFIPEEVSSVTVSVIIACRNEEENLPCLLNDLHLQDYDPGLFETIIVDDKSTDNTFLTASSLNQLHNFKVIQNYSRGKKSAIKSGVDAASGKLIITTDADCRLDRRWISAIASFYSSTKSDMIIAPVQLENRPGFSGRFRELEFLSLQGVTAGTAEAGYPVMCNGANLAFVKEAFIRHSENLHNEISSGDDIFFLHSLKKETDSKITWLCSPEAIVTTGHTDTLNLFIKQRARWLSKAKAYDDRFSILISLVTLIAVLLNILFLICTIINRDFFLLFLVAFIIKSIPDFLILSETTGRYDKRRLMKWFIPAQIVYPYYVLTVIVRSLFFKNSWK